ncbi:MAG: 50S ribosomal protein L11 methyltransferase [Thermoflexibacteraceae bacterium]|jgi:ribosomal protein L11 methyltransferase
MSSFIVLKVQVANAELSEVLQYELSQIGFDVFLETENGFETSIEKDLFSKEAVGEVLEMYQDEQVLSYTVEEVAKQNWNEVWEQNFEPIVVANKCLIRAEFHQIPEKYDYELVITPKMSFGTGHHATTSLMVEALMEMDCSNKTVADCGCGTGILGIMAMKLGAKYAIGCDIEDWSVENTLENAQNNQVQMDAVIGTAQNFVGKQFDIVLANIQLNVLLEEMNIYAQLVNNGAYLLMSGIHVEYISTLLSKAEEFGFQLVKHTERNNWAMVQVQKL